MIVWYADDLVLYGELNEDQEEKVEYFVELFN